MNKLELESFDKTTVTSRLIRWGAWKMRSGVALGYPSMAVFMGLGGSNPPDWCGQAIDSECVQTNLAVERLTLFPQVAIRVEYISGYKDTAVKAHLCGISKRRYYEYLQLAHQQVANSLNLLLISPHKHDTNMVSCLEMRSA